MTIREILLRAYAKDKKTQPGQIATEATELRHVAYRAWLGLWMVAARINPLFFGKSEAVAYAAPGWAVPADLELLFWLEDNTGAEVVEVPYNDRALESGARPAVYFLGGTFQGAGNNGDPGAGDALTFYYSRIPDEPADIDTAVDASWPEQFNELWIHEVAIYLNLKEGDESRAGLLQELKAERDRWARLYAAHLEHVSVIGVGNAPPVRAFPSNSIVPLGSLLAGGSEAFG